MIETRIEFNGDRKMTLHPPEERDVKILDLMLNGIEQLTVKKVGSDFVLTPTKDVESHV